LRRLKGKATLNIFFTIKNLLKTNLKEPENSLRNEPSETPNASPVQAAPGAAAKAEKVRSSRYEWEGQKQ